MEAIKYYFVIASQEFLVKKEPLEEVLRERIQYYCKAKKSIDFWLLPNPKFLQTQEFKILSKKFPQKTLAIVSTNKIFITWLKLRINNVFIGEFSAPSEAIETPLDFDSN